MGWLLIADIIANSNQKHHTKHKHTNPHTTARKPTTYLTRHHNHNKLTTKKHWLDHNAGIKLRSTDNPDNLQNKDKLQNTTAPQNLYTNYNKANWQEFTQEIEQTLADTEAPQNAHTATKILTNAILAADKHHITKGKIHHTHKLMPEHIRNMIKQRNRTRQQNPKDPLLAQKNTNIDKEIQNHKHALWKQHITDNWDHKTNTHTLWENIKWLTTQKNLHKHQTSLSPLITKQQ